MRSFKAEFLRDEHSVRRTPAAVSFRIQMIIFSAIWFVVPAVAAVAATALPPTDFSDLGHNSATNLREKATDLTQSNRNSNNKSTFGEIPAIEHGSTVDGVTAQRKPDFTHSGEGTGMTSQQEKQNYFQQQSNLGQKIIDGEKPLDTRIKNQNLEPGAVTGSAQEVVKPGEDEEKDICFPIVGCFAMGKPWKSVLRPIAQPNSPESIQANIFFYSRPNPEKRVNITLYPQVNMNGAPFDSSKVTAIIVHGFATNGDAAWIKDLKDVYLKQVDANVMIVNWEKGATLLNYLKVAGNTRVVGKLMGMFVKYLIEDHRADPRKFHLIGHSLGAQICSYLAKDVPGIARLTALDPAQPGFEGFDRVVRLDKTDAEFVDVVHTNAKPFIPTLGLGMIAPYGHVDFYMNGGFDQPGCLILAKEELPTVKSLSDLAKFPVEAISKAVTCPHGRSYDFFIEALNETKKCIFWGHKADTSNVLQSVTNTLTQGVLKKAVALSSTCNKENCVPLGLGTEDSPLRGSFVVTTAARRPFCISEPGIPPETEPAGSSATSTEEQKERRPIQSAIQKIARKFRAL